MNCEQDFQKALDANPTDATLRLVFADWLEEHDDPRAEGYRAVGFLQVLPDTDFNYKYSCVVSENWKRSRTDLSVVPLDWYYQIPWNSNLYGASIGNGRIALNESRKSAEEKIVNAYLLLSNERKRQLFNS